MTKGSDISQLRLLPILFIMVCLTGAILWLSRSPALEHYIFVRRQASWRIHADRCSLAGPYASMTERLLLDYAFRPDLARKKVYLVGGCLMEEVVNTTVLEGSLAEMGIFGLPGYNFAGLHETVDCLAQNFAFGQHMDHRTLILLGLTVDMTEPAVWPSPADHFRASGLYECGDQGIRLKSMCVPRRWVILHRMRIAQFLHSFWALRPRILFRVPPTGVVPEMDASEVAKQLDALRCLMRDLKRTGATVAAVITPNATWLETPGRIRVREAMLAMCQEEGLEVQDLSRLVEDKYFLDRDHLTYEAQQATHEKLIPVIQPFLTGTDPFEPLAVSGRPLLPRPGATVPNRGPGRS